MRISPINLGQQPAAMSPEQTKAASVRERAIAKLMGGAPSGGIDQNNVSPENLSAVSVGKNDIGEGVADPGLSSDSPGEDPSSSTPETSAVEAQVATTKQDQSGESPEDNSKQLSLLAKQQKALRLKQQQLENQYKQREEELKRREEAFAAKERETLTNYISKDTLRSNPLGVLNDAEISYDDLVQQLMNPAPQDPKMVAHINRLEAQIKRMEEQLTNTSKAQTERQQEAYEASIRQLNSDAQRLVDKDPNFETIKSTNSTHEVVALIEKTFQKDGTLLTVEEAAQMVEDYLVEEGLKIAKLEKIKKRLSLDTSKSDSSAKVQQPSTTPTEPQAQKQPQTVQMKTLTNSTSAGSRKLTSRERAIMAFAGDRKQGL